jgi:hypothetical protein
MSIPQRAIEQRESMFASTLKRGFINLKKILKVFKKKYHQLYVHESQRDDPICEVSSILKAVQDMDKKQMSLKDSAIHYSR